MSSETSTLRFYGRRKGRPLSQAMQRRLDELLPRLEMTAGPHTQASLTEMFSAEDSTPPTELCLEIGFGGGEHLSALARANPQMGFIGAEPFAKGSAPIKPICGFARASADKCSPPPKPISRQSSVGGVLSSAENISVRLACVCGPAVISRRGNSSSKRRCIA